MATRITRKQGVCLTQELPSSIVAEILSRLSVCSLLRCKCVCKTWFDIIVSDPFFARAQLARANASKSRATNVMAVLQGRRDVELFELQPTRHNYTKTQTRAQTQIPLKTKLKLPGKESSIVAVVGSCNGLLCLHEGRRQNMPSRVYVCNPILGEYVPLPQFQPKTLELCMFGFSSVTGQYKILRFLDTPLPQSPKTHIKVQVFTLGRDETWRNIGSTPCPSNFFNYSLGFYCRGRAPQDGPYNWDLHGTSVTLNGALHWLVTTPSRLIACFDIDTEQFHPFPDPPLLAWRVDQIMSLRELKVLQNCLCLIGVRVGFSLTVWSMKEYGVAESWCRLYTLETASLPTRTPFGSPSYHYHPYTTWKDRELLISVSHKPSYLISHNLSQNRVSILSIYGMKLGIVIPIDFAPSLLSLKDIVMPESVKIVKYRK